MALTRTAYRDYLFEKIDDNARLAIAHRMYQANFVQKIKQVLAEYELAKQIKAAQAGQRTKVKILDVGCGEGLYLHDVAGELEKQGLLAGTLLYGIDNDRTTLATATEQSSAISPPRPYLNFYQQDLTQPFEPAYFIEPELGSEAGRARSEKAELTFDFIYAHITLTFLPNARQNLATLYELLAPGGVIYLRDLVLHEGEGGWQIHPALRDFSAAVTRLTAMANEGQDVSLKYAEWLREMEAELVQAIPDVMISGGHTQVGMDTLRVIVMTLRNTRELLVASGAMTVSQVNDLLVTLYREIDASWQGTTTYMNTVARKPARRGFTIS